MASRGPPPASLFFLAALQLPSGASAEPSAFVSSATVAKDSPVRSSLRRMAEGLDTSGTPTAPARTSPVVHGAALDGDRSIPDFDGRPSAPVELGDALLWGPRVALYPVHLVMEWVVRKPIVGLLTVMEKNHVAERLGRLFTFRDGKSGIYPTFLADFGLQPSVGLATFHRDVLTEGDQISLTASFWVEEWIRVAGAASTPLFPDGASDLSLFGEYVSRPDQPFYGIGPSTTQDDRGDYRIRAASGGLRLANRFGSSSGFTLDAGYRDVRLLDGQGPTLTQRLNEGRFTAPPPGFDDSYGLVEGTAVLVLDSRAERDPVLITDPGTGLLLELGGGLGVDPRDEQLIPLRASAESAAFWDVSGLGHVLAMRLRVEGVAQLGSTALPFTELVGLGGVETMRGFLPRRFIGQSAALLTFSYRYPIWYLLDAELFASFGNAWNQAFEDFALEAQYLASGLSLRTTFDRSRGLELIVAIGTDRLDRGFEVESVRVSFGVTEGF